MMVCAVDALGCESARGEGCIEGEVALETSVQLRALLHY